MTYSWSQVVLGTAQLSGWPYGKEPPLGREEAYRLLDAAWDTGVRAYDTAEGYGAAAERLEWWRSGYRPAGNMYPNRPGCSVTTKVTRGSGLAARAAGALQRYSGHNVEILLHSVPEKSDVETIYASTGRRPGASVATAPEAGEAMWAGASCIQLPMAEYAALKLSAPAKLRIDVRSVFQGGANVSEPVFQLRAALQALRPGDRIVVGCAQLAHIEDLSKAVDG